MKSSYDLKFDINDLRQKQLVLNVQGIAFLMAGLISAQLIPNLIYQLMFSDPTQLTQPPVWIQYLPVALLGLGLTIFLYAVLQAVLIGSQIGSLQKKRAEKMAMGDDCCHGCDCSGHGSADVGEMMAAAEKIVSKAEAKTAKKVSKKSSKKTKKAAKK